MKVALHRGDTQQYCAGHRCQANRMLRRHAEMIHESAKQQRFWGYATTCFALAQAAAAYAYALLFDLAGAFTPLFITGAGLMLVALAVDIAAGSWESAR